jgi:polyhydroxyalkanoate synthase
MAGNPKAREKGRWVAPPDCRPRRIDSMINPMLNKVLDAQKAMLDESLKAWNRFFAFPKVADQAMRVRVGLTPHDIVYEEDTLRLLHYHNEAGVTVREPLLICYALVNRPYILDLQPDRSVVRRLLQRGHDVYLIDWGVPSAADRTMRLQDYVCGLLKHCVDFVLEESGVPKLNLFGYCMGGTMSTMYTTLYPEQINTLTLLAAPIEFSKDDGLLRLWTQEQYFDVDRLIDAFGNCPATLLQASFQLIKPVQNYSEKYLNFWEHLQDEKFTENFLVMEKWGQDNIPVAGETFREFVKYLYQRNQLVKGEFRLGNQCIKLERIVCPLLLLTADQDHLVPPVSTLELEPHVLSSEVKKLSIPAGHIGLAVSSKAHRQLWPGVANWLAEHSAAI